jgi:hypothetical protein
VDIFYKKNNIDFSEATACLYDNFGKPFQTIKYKFTSYKEIEKIVQRLLTPVDMMKSPVG